MTPAGPRSTAIHDLDDPRIAVYRSLKGRELEREGVFIAEGEKVVRLMVAGGYDPVSCLISDDAVPATRALLCAIRKRGGAVYTAPGALIERIIGFRFHRGIMAAGRCPVKRTVAGLGRMRARAPLFVALNAVNDPQNVGLIVRNAAAFGASALIVDGATHDPFYRKAVRVSMGTVFALPVCYEEDLPAALGLLRERYGARIIAATPGRGAVDLARAGLAGPACFVFGNEDAGLSRGVLRAADARVRIPIAPGVDSLNVASAAAVCLYEASRRAAGERRKG